MSSIALACNVYNDAAPLRGLLETGASYFDNIFIIHSGPCGAYSTDGTIELCESFGIFPVFDDMNRGFGAIRTRLIHDCGCEWVMILDADERFFPLINAMSCEGVDRYPNPPNPKLNVINTPHVINQGAHVKHHINNPDIMAMRFTRRHWFDFAMTKPAENWMLIWDHQLRCVRNHPSIRFALNMHERLIDSRTGEAPSLLEQDPVGGPHIDHFHLHFRKERPGHKEANEKYYASL